MPRGLQVDDLIASGVSAPHAQGLYETLAALLAQPGLSAPEIWQRLTAGPLGQLTPDLPFAVHLAAHAAVFADWDERQGPPPAWLPAARADRLPATWPG